MWNLFIRLPKSLILPHNSELQCWVNSCLRTKCYINKLDEKIFNNQKVHIAVPMDLDLNEVKPTHLDSWSPFDKKDCHNVHGI